MSDALVTAGAVVTALTVLCGALAWLLAPRVRATLAGIVEDVLGHTLTPLAHRVDRLEGVLLARGADTLDERGALDLAAWAHKLLQLDRWLTAPQCRRYAYRLAWAALTVAATERWITADELEAWLYVLAVLFGMADHNTDTTAPPVDH